MLVLKCIVAFTLKQTFEALKLKWIKELILNYINNTKILQLKIISKMLHYYMNIVILKVLIADVCDKNDKILNAAY